MEFIRRQWLQIQAFLDELPRDTKMLIVSLVVILGLAGFVIVQYAASSEMVTLQQVAPDRQSLVLTRLEAAGIPAEPQGGVIRVAKEKHTDALAVLAQFDLLASDTTAAFDDMIAKQSPWMPDRQNKQAFLVAKQKVLAQIVTKMVGIRSADVIVSMPENTGFGATHVDPTASVSVVTDGRASINRRQVEAIAGLVAGAVAGMKPQDVVVIDANSGRQHTVQSAEDMGSSEMYELVQAQEQNYRRKIAGHLSYIPGVMVAVNVRTDPVRMKQTEQWIYEKTEPLRRQMDRTETRQNVKRSGSPGAQSNVGASIETGGTTSLTEEVTESTSEFGDKNLTERAVMKSVGGTREVNVTVNVPRPYFVGLYRQQNPPAEGEAAGEEQPVDDAALKSLIDEQLRQIEQSVQPLITAEAPGIVRAYMIPDPQQLMASLSPRQQAGGVMMVLEQDWAKSVGLGALALISLAIMFGMVRKATQQPQVPSVEELAGLPPLPNEDELVESFDDDQTLTGVELGDEEVRARQIAEQLGSMIKENPGDAAQLINKWVQAEE